MLSRIKMKLLCVLYLFSFIGCSFAFGFKNCNPNLTIFVPEGTRANEIVYKFQLSGVQHAEFSLLPVTSFYRIGKHNGLLYTIQHIHLFDNFPTPITFFVTATKSTYPPIDIMCTFKIGQTDINNNHPVFISENFKTSNIIVLQRPKQLFYRDTQWIELGYMIRMTGTISIYRIKKKEILKVY